MNVSRKSLAYRVNGMLEEHPEGIKTDFMVLGLRLRTAGERIQAISKLLVSLPAIVAIKSCSMLLYESLNLI